MERLRKYNYPKLTSGQAENVEVFFEKLIKPQFQHKDKIRELHKMLISYIELDDATFFLRLYGSSPKSYQLLRRGFLTQYPDNKRMVFCDNTFSMLFAGLKIGGFSVSEHELSDYLKQEHLVCSFGTTSEERELSYYTSKKAIRVPLNSKGWYQAHIKPTGYGFGELSKKNLRDFFPNPDRNEWNSSKIRMTSENLTLEQKQLLTAHFVRLVHPLNSFLVPKSLHMKYSGKRIGEELEVIQYVRDYLRNEFPAEYAEFEKITLTHTFPEYTTSLTNLSWFEDQVTSTKTKKITKEKKQLIPETPKDSVIEDEVEFLDNNLEKWLKSIGKEAFVEMLFPSIAENNEVTTDEIARKHPKFAEFKTQNSRLSTAKSIFRNGLEREALEVIVESSRLNSDLVKKAKSHLDKLV